MSPIDYALLGGNGGSGEPPEGLHEAVLAVAKLVVLDKGERLVTEWQVPGAYYWTSWHGFEPNRIEITQDYLDGLGVDRATVTDDESFEAALEQLQGESYVVRCTAWSGGVNTFIEERLGASQARSGARSGASAQTSLADVPIDSSGLPEPAGVSAAPATSNLPPEDDIPF